MNIEPAGNTVKPTPPGFVSIAEMLPIHANISLRDLYAGLAMQITFANPESTIEHDAELAFKMANAMIAERNKS